MIINNKNSVVLGVMIMEEAVEGRGKGIMARKKTPEAK